MQIMELQSWSAFKSLVTAKALLIQYSETPMYYDIFAPEAGVFLWHTTIQKDGGSDQTDFETNYKANANAPLEIKAGVGRPDRISMSPQPLGTYNKWKGYQLSLPAGATFAFVDVQFPTTVYFRGGHLYTNDADIDDKLSADVLLATNDSVLMPKMIDGVPISSGMMIPFLSDESMAFPNYYKLRLSISCPDGVSETEIRYHNVMVEFFQ